MIVARRATRIDCITGSRVPGTTADRVGLAFGCETLKPGLRLYRGKCIGQDWRVIGKIYDAQPL